MFANDIQILIVDDMKTMRKIVIKACKIMGFENFVEAEDGEQGWTAAKEQKFDLIISDWNMPNCSGLEFLKRVRGDANLNGTPFILLTAESERDQVVEAIKSGVDSYVTKPFDANTLKMKVEEVYKKRAAAA